MSRGELASASRLGPRQRTPRATSRLQTAKELHQVGIIPPFQSGVGWLNPWIAGRECLRFHCQVGFSIDISRVHRDVAQPCADRIDVHARAKEVSSRGVPDGMRAYPFLPQGLDLVGCGWEKPLYHRVNTETRHGITIAVDEQASIAGPPVTQWQERGHRLFPERTETDLSSFTVELHDSSSINVPFQIFDRHTDRLAGPGTGVVEKQQEAHNPCGPNACFDRGLAEAHPFLLSPNM